MIDTEDQEALFQLIADYLSNDITCMAIGDTAMMFKGYKTVTKDIDLVFDSESDRNKFIHALEKLGYKRKSLKFIYDERREKDKNKPVMYSRGEERFDLFVKNVFGIGIDMDKFEERYDFIGKKELIILLPSKEILILMKSATNRDRDYEDIEDIIKMNKVIDWKYLVEEAIRQSKNNKWILLDLEEKMQTLRKITLIKKEFFDMIHKAS